MYSFIVVFAPSGNPSNFATVSESSGKATTIDVKIIIISEAIVEIVPFYHYTTPRNAGTANNGPALTVKARPIIRAPSLGQL